jgi:hypothetical protein
MCGRYEYLSNLEAGGTLVERIKVRKEFAGVLGNTTSDVNPLHTLKVNSHMPCRSHAVPMSCRAALIHTCYASPQSFSTVPFAIARVVAGNSRTASPTV